MANVDLSILVCSVHTRYDNFLIEIQDQLFSQYRLLSLEDKERVEILVLTDNKRRTVGNKREKLVRMAQGRYVVFVDDDDRISPDYVETLLEATHSDTDCIVFQLEARIDGRPSKICYYSKDVGRDYNTADAFYRIPNHICCVKKELAVLVGYADKSFGEDSDYSKRLLPLIKTEHKIDKVLYCYDYNSSSTETQKKDSVVDVIILSKASDQVTRTMTQTAVDTCIAGAAEIPVNVVVVENGPHAYTYDGAKTVHDPSRFNYNKFANNAAKFGRGEWIVVANNDLVFSQDWLRHLLAAESSLVCPRNPQHPVQRGILKNTYGDAVGDIFSGWCFMIRRSLWEAIGGFDTDVSFWCSDDAVVEQVKARGVVPMLVSSSVVTHSPSSTLKTVDPRTNSDLTWRNVYIYNNKYNKDKFVGNMNYRRWLQSNGLK